MVGDREEAKRGCGLGRNSRLRAHNMTHLSGFPNFPNSGRTPLCFHGPTHPTETTLGVLFFSILVNSGFGNIYLAAFGATEELGQE